MLAMGVSIRLVYLGAVYNAKYLYMWIVFGIAEIGKGFT
jgi:hypothetical protein